MSTRRSDSFGRASGILIAGILGGSFCHAGPIWAQAAVDRRQSGSLVDPVLDSGLTLRTSTVLSSAVDQAGSRRSPVDRSEVLLLAVSPAITVRASSSVRPTHFSSLAPEEPFDELPAPYDPTVRPSGPGAVGRSTPGEGGEVASGNAVGEYGSVGVTKWGLAPIRWGGTTGVQLSRFSSSDGGSSTSAQQFLNLRAATYIYQPWLAQVTGSLNLTPNQTTTSTGSAGGGNSAQGGTTVNGGMSLSLVPMSRFPFIGEFDHSDTRNSTDFVDTQYTSTRYSMRQSYVPVGGGYNVQGSYAHNTLVSVNNFDQKDTVDNFNAGFSRSAGPQRMAADGSYSQSMNENTGENSRLMQFNSQFAYQLEDNLSYNSMTTITDNTFNALNSIGGTSMGVNHGRYMQFNSYVNWQPEGEEEDIPLYVTGGVRTLSSLNEYGGTLSESKSYGGNVSANYVYSNNLSLNANAMVTQVTNTGGATSITGASSGGGQLFSSMGGGATYSGDPLRFENFDYTWSVGGNANHSSSGGVGVSDTTLSGQFNHGLSTSYRLNEASSIFLNGSQSLAEINTTAIGNTMTLTNTVGATYSAVTGENLQSNVSLNYSDTLTSGETTAHYRFLNLLVNGRMQFNLRSSGSANLSFQWSGSDNPSIPIPSATGLQAGPSQKESRINIYGSANYQHSRAFDIKNLRYSADFFANTLMQNDRLSGSTNAAPVGAIYSFANRLTYRIGLLDFELSGQLNASAGRNNALIFFRAYRNFGA